MIFWYPFDDAGELAGGNGDGEVDDEADGGDDRGEGDRRAGEIPATSPRTKGWMTSMNRDAERRPWQAKREARRGPGNSEIVRVVPELHAEYALGEQSSAVFDGRGDDAVHDELQRRSIRL